MNILIFDMDGVLLRAKGYHRALQETVRLVGELLGRDVHLTEEQIAQFESLGISSEWHSSALCHAVMVLDKLRGLPTSRQLDLSTLFELITDQPMREAAIQRAMQALALLAGHYGLPVDGIMRFVAESEDLKLSQTKRWFQTLVLGSEIYHQLYQEPAPMVSDSYLKLYDQRLLSHENASWLQGDAMEYRGVIMTNRPSFGPAGFEDSPDAKMGAELVGLSNLPMVGYGEIAWLAAKTGLETGRLNKPHAAHALAAILAASGWQMEKSLHLAGQQPSAWRFEDLAHLSGSEVTVFEDTPGGILSVETAASLLGEVGVDVSLRKIGIAEDESKRVGLEAVGAEVFLDINVALENVLGKA